MPVLIDLTEQRFGRLIAMRPVGKTAGGEYIWGCICDCGNKHEVRGSSLRIGKTKSCGCLRKDHARTHGQCGTPEYNSWSMLNQRCRDRNHDAYEYYGERGVSVCKRWIDSFENFIADMGPKSSPSHSIDRIDNDGNYEASNCRWSTQSEQMRNQRLRTENTSGLAGVRQHANGKWKVGIGVDGKQIHLGYFDSFEGAASARKSAEIKYWGRA